MGGAGGAGTSNTKNNLSLQRFEKARDAFISFLDECRTFGDKEYSHNRYPSIPYYSDLFECLVEAGACVDKNEFLCADYPEEWNDCFLENETFSCKNGDLIRGDYQCDTIPDCENAEDEKNCQDLWFRCDDGSAVLATQRCDARIQCADGSDEDDCQIKRVPCDSQKSVPEWEICDLAPDCADGSDESSGCVSASCN
jgi:hypothetical protein